jgi:hypothetical protein
MFGGRTQRAGAGLGCAACEWNLTAGRDVPSIHWQGRSDMRSILLLLLGVPIPIIILLALFVR